MQFDVRQLNALPLRKIILLCAGLCIGNTVFCIAVSGLLNAIGLGFLGELLAICGGVLHCVLADRIARGTRFFLCYPLTLTAFALVCALSGVVAFSTGLFGSIDGAGNTAEEQMLTLFAGALSGALVLVVALVLFALCLILPAITIPFALHGRKIYKQTDWFDSDNG